MLNPASRYRPNVTPCGRTRREFLWEVGGGFAGLALVDLLSRDGFFAKTARAHGGRVDVKRTSSGCQVMFVVPRVEG